MKKVLGLISCLILSLVLFGTAKSYAADNLIINGSAEEEMTGWNEFQNNDNPVWWPSTSGTSHDAIDGSTFFWPSKRGCSYACMYQDVDVSGFAAGTWMSLSAWLANYDQSPHDQATLKVQIFDAQNNVLYEDYSLQRNPEWQFHELNFALPINASTVRVLCIADRFVGSDNDAYFDDIVLTPEDGTVAPVIITGDKTVAKPGDTIQLSASDGKYKQASYYEWSSSYNDIATVDENGLVTMASDPDESLVDAEVWIYAKSKKTGVIGKYFINSERENIEAEETDNTDNAKPMAVLDPKSGTLTFYFDSKHTPGENAWEIPIIFGDNEANNLWHSKSENIKKIVIDASFKDYKPISTEFWFYGLENVTEIENIGNIDTSEAEYMSYMFSGCINLTELDVSGFVTTNVQYMDDMFSNCQVLSSLDVSGFDTSNVKNMRSMFINCFALKELDVSGFMTSKVDDMYGVFAGCSQITSLNVSGFDTSNVTRMSSMFLGCEKLTELDVSGFNTEKVTDMACMFNSCSGLKSLDVSRFNTSNVTDMSGLFLGCSGLTSLNVSGFDTKNVTEMSVMFEGCSGLTSLDLISFNTQNVTDMRAMFWDCSGLKKINLTGFNTAKVTDMSDMFHGCKVLTELDLSGFRTDNLKDTATMFEGCVNLKKIYTSDKFRVNSVSLDDEMFDGCINLSGGKGTAYLQDNNSSSYAKIDGGAADPGYFTERIVEFVITKQPVSVSVNTGETAKFSVTATGIGLKYQWQYRMAGTTEWKNWSGKTTTAITVPYDAKKDGMGLRCVITNSYGNKLTSNAVKLVYKQGFAITGNPADVNTTKGTTASFKVTATGTGLKYQWQFMLAGKTNWTGWTGKTSATLSVPYDKKKNNMKVRCQVTDGSGNKLTSKEAVLVYTDLFEITTQPVNVTVESDHAAPFSVAVAGNGLTYQWQFKLASASGWKNWEGKTASLLKVPYDIKKNGMLVRCVITNDKGAKLTSGEAELVYNGAAPAINRQPASISVASGHAGVFSIGVSGDTLSFQWQYKLAGTTTWKNWSGKTESTLKVAYDAKKDGMSVRCVVTDKNGKTVTSDAAVMTYTK